MSESEWDQFWFIEGQALVEEAIKVNMEDTSTTFFKKNIFSMPVT
jgi:hypothetical protein